MRIPKQNVFFFSCHAFGLEPPRPAGNFIICPCLAPRSFSDCPNRIFGSRLRQDSRPKQQAVVSLALRLYSCCPCVSLLRRRLIVASYCHSEERRIIPHRLVNHWDFTRHRVCKDAAAFLDATRFVPLINLPEECPRLFAEQQVCVLKNGCC